MSQFTLEQSLSALMDGEADELELQRILKHSQDPELRVRWQQWQQVRGAMRQELPAVQVDLSARISAAIADETFDAQPATRDWNRWSKVAVAATVTLAVLGGVRFYNQGVDVDGASPLAHIEQPSLYVEQQARSTPVVLASYGRSAEPVGQEQQQPTDDYSQWHREHLPLYLKQHVQHVEFSRAASGLPYARAASLEGH